MKKAFLLPLLAIFCLAGCKSSQPTIISDPHAVGTVLPTAEKLPFVKYDERMKGRQHFSATDNKSRAALRKYMSDGFIRPLQSIKGMKVEEFVYDGGYELSKITISTDLMFKTMKKELTEEGKALLRSIAGALQKRALTVVCIGCHCEQSTFQNRGALTQARAEAAASALATMGVAQERLMPAVGCSDQHPVADNATSEGRQANRRIEIYICPDKPLFEKILNGETGL